MVARIGLLGQALLTLMLGMYLSSLGVPGSAEEASIQYGKEIIDRMPDSDIPQAQDIKASSKLALEDIGDALTFASILEIVGIVASLLFA